jgi:methylmalonyl-CoA/ethylmalonyl-CoA epimerase
MSATGIHHLGVAVADLDVAVERYRRLFGAEVEAEERLERQGVAAAALRFPDGSRVELLAPLGEDTPVGRFLQKRGEGMHHVAYDVADIGGELARLRSEGATLVDETPRHGLYGQVAFIHPEAVFGVLTELVQRQGAS